MNSLVSIITPSYNSSQFIVECIQSVLSQTYVNWEMLIVDDCSEDNSKEIISFYSTKDKRIKPVFLKKNIGAAEARNVAIRQSNGKYIAFLDSDDLWYPKKLEKQLSFMKKKDIAFSFTAYQIMSEDGNNFLNVVPSPDKMSYSSYLRNTVIGCLTVVIDVEKTGRITMPNIKVSEDMALWLQLLKNGFNAYGLNEVLSNYRENSDSLSSNKISASKFVWKVYREVEKLSFIYSVWCFVNYALNAIRKRI